MFEQELNYFKKNQSKLYKKYANKILIIQNTKLLYVSNSLKEAYEYASINKLIGKVAIQKCGNGHNAYTATIGLI